MNGTVCAGLSHAMVIEASATQINSVVGMLNPAEGVTLSAVDPFFEITSSNELILKNVILREQMGNERGQFLCENIQY